MTVDHWAGIALVFLAIWLGNAAIKVCRRLWVEVSKVWRKR